MSLLPCQRVIGKACFKAHAEFARRAIAYRLLHLLIPPDIASLLPKTLKDPLIAPGVKIPLDAKFPPGTCIIPGCSFPAGWDPDQEPPECAKSAPLPTLAMIAGGANPNVFLSPGPSGPLAVQTSPAPSAPHGSVTIIGETDDGIIRYGGSSWDWDTYRNAVTGTYVRNNQGLEATAHGVSRTASWNNLTRSFYRFVLSGIEAGANISSAVLKIVGSNQFKANACAQAGTQENPITKSDFDAFTGVYFGTVDWENSSSTPDIYNSITFNSAGIAYLNSIISSSAKICVREYDHDYLGTEPAQDTDYENGGRFAEDLTEAYRPRLEIEY